MPQTTPLPQRRWFGFWDYLAAIPHLPVLVWISFLGWGSLFHGGLVLVSHNTLPTWLVLTWSILFALGATMGVFGGLTRATRTEQAGLALLGFGLMFYGTIAYFEALHPTGSVLAAVCFTAMCALRIRVLKRARKAQVIAASIQGGE